MIKIAIILFRECLEIALLLGIILAVTKEVPRSRFYIILGMMLGIITASVFAFGVQYITITYFGLGGELFDVAVIFLTIVLIGWTVVWMPGYESNIARKSSDISTNTTGIANFLLVGLVMLTILREGAEIMLLLYSVSTVDKLSVNEYLLGLGVGSVSGFLVGMLIYKGLVRFSSSYIFKISTTLLILIAAGLASKAAAILTSSALVELFESQIWDSSWLISDNSNTGRVLNAILGYNAKPNVLQVMFFITTVFVIYSLRKWRITKIKQLKYASHKKSVHENEWRAS